MSTKLDKCSMPNCYTYTERGKRLCKKHASSGKDLRIPVYVLDLGLDRIYETIQKQKKGFSVEVILDILDPGYADRLDGVNCKNGMAKLLRSLRANGYLTKRGRFNGFVIYDLGQGWDQSKVFIEDDRPVSTGATSAEFEAGFQAITDKLSSVEDKLANKDKQIASLEKKLKFVTDKVSNIEIELVVFLKAQKEATILIQDKVAALADMVTNSPEQRKKEIENMKALEATIAEIQNQATGLKQDGNGCPIAKLREQMHVIFGGKRSAAKL